LAGGVAGQGSPTSDRSTVGLGDGVDVGAAVGCGDGSGVAVGSAVGGGAAVGSMVVAVSVADDSGVAVTPAGALEVQAANSNNKTNPTTIRSK